MQLEALHEVTYIDSELIPNAVGILVYGLLPEVEHCLLVLVPRPVEHHVECVQAFLRLEFSFLCQVGLPLFFDLARVAHPTHSDFSVI